MMSGRPLHGYFDTLRMSGRRYGSNHPNPAQAELVEARTPTEELDA